jgi:site-specific recombinase XerD
MRGDIFTRIKTYSPYPTQQDFVFTEFGSKEAISDKILRRLWEVIRAKSGISDFGRYSYYSLRHTFATYRLMYGKIDVYTLSKIMGCSVQMIEYQYGNIKGDGGLYY